MSANARMAGQQRADDGAPGARTATADQLLLTALGLRGRFGAAALALFASSLAMNLYGAFWFVSHFAQ